MGSSQRHSPRKQIVIAWHDSKNLSEIYAAEHCDAEDPIYYIKNPFSFAKLDANHQLDTFLQNIQDLLEAGYEIHLIRKYGQACKVFDSEGTYPNELADILKEYKDRVYLGFVSSVSNELKDTNGFLQAMWENQPRVQEVFHKDKMTFTQGTKRKRPRLVAVNLAEKIDPSDPCAYSDLDDLIEECKNYKEHLRIERSKLNLTTAQRASGGHQLVRHQQIEVKLESIDKIEADLMQYRRAIADKNTGPSLKDTLETTLETHLPVIAARRDSGGLGISAKFWQLIDALRKKLGCPSSTMGVTGASVAKHISAYFTKPQEKPTKEKENNLGEHSSKNRLGNQHKS